MTSAVTPPSRVQWLDHARGLSILLIVLLHSTYALEGVVATGPVAQLIDLVRPFRLPALFFLSGLFLAKVIDTPWRDFADRRLLHYAYFYALWATIEFAALKGTRAAQGQMPADAGWQYAMLFVNPHGPLWFIYALPFFFLMARLVRGIPAWVVLPVAALLSVLPIETGWVITDRLASRFVYFYAGYVFAQPTKALGLFVQRQRLPVLIGLLAWSMAHVALMRLAQWHEAELTAFVLGVAGVVALVVIGAWVAALRGMGWLAYIGSHSLTVFLAFPLLLIVTRKLLQLARIELNGDLMILLMASGAIVGGLILERLVRHTPLKFLFQRPRWARLQPAPATIGASQFKNVKPAAAGEGH
jgi:uncharacterized membrane protein YcfT